jgi:hypothetical protein
MAGEGGREKEGAARRDRPEEEEVELENNPPTKIAEVKSNPSVLFESRSCTRGVRILPGAADTCSPQFNSVRCSAQLHLPPPDFLTRESTSEECDSPPPHSPCRHHHQQQKHTNQTNTKK